MDISGECGTNNFITIVGGKSDFYLTDLQLGNQCSESSPHYILKVKEGQIMNISGIIMQPSIISGGTYGTIKDRSNNKLTIIGDGPRKKHLLSSSSNEVEIMISENANTFNRFMLHVEGKIKI